MCEILRKMKKLKTKNYVWGVSQAEHEDKIPSVKNRRSSNRQREQ